MNELTLAEIFFGILLPFATVVMIFLGGRKSKPAIFQELDEIEQAQDQIDRLRK